MAHFAELDDQNFVTRVLVVCNDVIESGGAEVESAGVDFLRGLYGPLTEWKQCSYNGNFRGRFPRPGTEYLADIDVFAETPPYPSWILNRSTGYCEAPVAKPSYDPTTHCCYWDEDSLQWVVMTLPPAYDRETQYVTWDDVAEEWTVHDISTE